MTSIFLRFLAIFNDFAWILGGPGEALGRAGGPRAGLGNSLGLLVVSWGVLGALEAILGRLGGACWCKMLSRPFWDGFGDRQGRQNGDPKRPKMIPKSIRNRTQI